MMRMNRRLARREIARPTAVAARRPRRVSRHPRLDPISDDSIEITLSFTFNVSGRRDGWIRDHNDDDDGELAYLLRIYTHMYNGLYVRHGGSVRHDRKTWGKLPMLNIPKIFNEFLHVSDKNR